MENEYDSVIWGGDINTDFLCDTVFTSNTIQFVEKLFQKSWDKYPIDFMHVFEWEEYNNNNNNNHNNRIYFMSIINVKNSKVAN